MFSCSPLQKYMTESYVEGVDPSTNKSKLTMKDCISEVLLVLTWFLHGKFVIDKKKAFMHFRD